MTKIKIKVHPNSSKEEIKLVNGCLEVWVKEKPIDNKVNLKLGKLLSGYFNKKVLIKSGLKSRIKTIEIK